jgi:hypothetical protein
LVSCGPSSKKTATDQEELDQSIGEFLIWTVIDAPARLIVNYLPGRHSLEEAREMIQQLDSSSAGGKPLFASDELAHCATALEEKYSHFESVPHTGKRGVLQTLKKWSMATWITAPSKIPGRRGASSM